MKKLFNLKVLSVLVLLCALVIVLILWPGRSHNGKNSSGMGISLISPAFAQERNADFLEREAGMSAYTNVGRSIDLAKAKLAFRTIERETNDYVIGSVALSGYAETEDVHVYVHKDGWIVAYYLKAEPTSKIVDWNGYSGGKITKTKLDIALLFVCSTAEVGMKDVKYYDFRYPDANRLMIVAEAMWNDKQEALETFKIKLPSDFNFHERSFSHYSKRSSGGYDHPSIMYINEKQISIITRNYQSITNYGFLSQTLLPFDTFHVIKIYSLMSDNTSYGAIVLVYQES